MVGIGRWKFNICTARSSRFLYNEVPTSHNLPWAMSSHGPTLTGRRPVYLTHEPRKLSQQRDVELAGSCAHRRHIRVRRRARDNYASFRGFLLENASWYVWGDQESLVSGTGLEGVFNTTSTHGRSILQPPPDRADCVRLARRNVRARFILPQVSHNSYSPPSTMSFSNTTTVFNRISTGRLSPGPPQCTLFPTPTAVVPAILSSFPGPRVGVYSDQESLVILASSNTTPVASNRRVMSLDLTSSMNASSKRMASRMIESIHSRTLNRTKSRDCSGVENDPVSSRTLANCLPNHRGGGGGRERLT